MFWDEFLCDDGVYGLSLLYQPKSAFMPSLVLSSVASWMTIRSASVSIRQDLLHGSLLTCRMPLGLKRRKGPDAPDQVQEAGALIQVIVPQRLEGKSPTRRPFCPL